MSTVWYSILSKIHRTQSKPRLYVEHLKAACNPTSVQSVGCNVVDLTGSENCRRSDSKYLTLLKTLAKIWEICLLYVWWMMNEHFSSSELVFIVRPSVTLFLTSIQLFLCCGTWWTGKPHKCFLSKVWSSKRFVSHITVDPGKMPGSYEDMKKVDTAQT